jgi:SAM-dependent methyltransferase
LSETDEMSVSETTHLCRVCGEGRMQEFFCIERATVFCNVLWQSRQEAMLAPQGRIALACCPHCGFIFNTAFDANLAAYNGSYENSLHYSPRFERYADELAGYLVKRYGLYGKTVVEIGCGRGEFLSKLAAIGKNRGVGFDPSLDQTKRSCVADDAVTVIGSFFDAAMLEDDPALICCRHVLEHIERPAEFLGELAASVKGKKCALFFEVPNSFYTLVDQGIWDIIYEHCSYYVKTSLTELFRRAGMTIEDVRTRYADQFLTIEAIWGGTAGHPTESEKPEPVIELAQKFSLVYNKKSEDWKRGIAGLIAQHKKVVLWGAGSKGVTFLNALGIGDEAIEFVVDVNPHKHGKYVPCSGQLVVEPEFCREYRPDVVVVMNAIYEPEIRHKLGEMGIHPQVAVA